MIRAVFISGLDDQSHLNVGGGYFLPRITVNGCIHVKPAIRHPEIEALELLLHDPRAGDQAFPDADVIFNTIANADRNRISLESAIKVCERTGRPTVNLPGAVLAATRDKIREMAAGLESLVVPRTVKAYLSDPADVEEILRRDLIGLPMVVRPLGTHGGIGLVRLETPADVRRVPFSGALYYLSDFMETAGEDGLYRKIRLFVVGGRVIARHMIIGRSWNVHMATRAEVMAAEVALIAEEEAFMADAWGALGEGIWKEAAELAERAGLDYFGIDGARAADGRLVVFEANANMNAFQQRGLETFPYLADPIREIREATEALILEKASAAGGPRGRGLTARPPG